ncbi:NAD(P)/FAD-dependent oxidoreductase [Azospirillum sp. ST 5-10]|uniref:NAD(P)/FAD-dependent oxidoreductase n=1 Tax=unclassified Azospirillum TaxID=2630922 RepID=UPI003F4A2A53
MHETDVVVIGAGPAGLFAVFQCGMLGLRTHVVDAFAQVGGQCAALYPEKPIYDVPGFPAVRADELVGRLSEQCRPFAPRLHLGRVATAIEDRPDGRLTVVTSDADRITAAAVIVATGGGTFGPNRPPLPGIDAYEGTSVHYFVSRRDAFAGKRVVIAGGGDSAVDWALSLAEVAASVRLVHRRPRFRAAPDCVRRLEALAAAGAVELVVPYQLHALDGADGVLSAVLVRDLEGRERRLDADALLPFFGLASDPGPVARWGIALERGGIRVDPATMATTRPGVFACGDIATYPGKLKLILCGFTEAAMAAHAAHGLARPGAALHFEHSTSRGVPVPA